MAGMNRIQQLCLWIVAAVLGLGIADLLHANALASIGLVAAVGIIIGVGFAAWQQLAHSD